MIRIIVMVKKIVNSCAACLKNCIQKIKRRRQQKKTKHFNNEYYEELSNQTIISVFNKKPTPSKSFFERIPYQLYGEIIQFLEYDEIYRTLPLLS